MRGNDEVILIVLFVVIGIAVLIGLAIAILFNLTLMRCLKRIRPGNRDMEPAMVFLNMVPCVGIVWIFITVTKIGSSLQKEFRSRRWPTEGEGFGTGVGIAYAILSIAGAIPYIGGLFSIAALVCFIIYWFQISGYSSRLAQEPYDDLRSDDDEADDDRDYKRRRLSRADDYDDRSPRDERIRKDWRDDDLDAPDERIRSGE